MNVRLAGIDAPEMAHFGGEAQPYSGEARDWLRKTTQGRFVRIQPLRVDQYGRLVASVWVRRWLFFYRNVSLAMVKSGYATVYVGMGAEYGGIRKQLEAAEQAARERRKGMWKQLQSGTFISPRAYKQQQRNKNGR